MSIDYYTGWGKPFVPFNATGYTSIEVLHFLNGRKFDNVALGYIQALRPTRLRVVRDGITLDAHRWRVTVWVDADENIQKIEQEVEVGLPEGVGCGADLDNAL